MSQYRQLVNAIETTIAAGLRCCECHGRIAPGYELRRDDQVAHRDCAKRLGWIK